MEKQEGKGGPDSGSGWDKRGPLAERAGLRGKRLPLFDNPEDCAQWHGLSRAGGYAVEGLAVRLGISKRQLERHFRAYAACTPKVWMTTQRMFAARRLLLGGATIKEVAAELGYRQVSHFCHAFKRCYERTPMEHLAFVEKLRRGNRGRKDVAF